MLLRASSLSWSRLRHTGTTLAAKARDRNNSDRPGRRPDDPVLHRGLSRAWGSPRLAYATGVTISDLVIRGDRTQRLNLLRV